MIDADRAAILDINAAWHGVPATVLMHNAGQAVASWVIKRHAPGRVLVLCGTSNNGGDGAVAAQAIAETGAAVRVVYAKDPSTIGSPEARLAYDHLDGARVGVETYRSPQRLQQLLKTADVVVDALLGVGSRGELRNPVRSIVVAANRSRRPIVSVDVPTGLGQRVCIRPQDTVTLHDRKPGLTRQRAGRVHVADIGIPTHAHDIGPGHLALRYPLRDALDHKGAHGRLLVLAGGPFPGAAILASAAALRAGTDLVHLLTPTRGVTPAIAYSPDLIVHDATASDAFVPDDVERATELASQADAVLIGPGMGRSPPTLSFMRQFLVETKRERTPVVVDADALAALHAKPALLHGRPAIATPHHGELKRWIGGRIPKTDAAYEAYLKAAAKRTRTTIIAKGPVDIVTDGRRLDRNRIHHPWMAAGGTGDCLAGFTAALLAMGMDAYDAACAATFLNGAAGLEAWNRRSWSARASDLVDAASQVLQSWVPDGNPHA